MLYILGGAARSGKSILSRKFVTERQTPYISTDLIISMLQRGVPSVGIKHGQEFIPKATNLWPIIKPFCESLIKHEPTYLVGGDGLLPKFIPELTEKYKGEVHVCFVGYTSISATEKLKEVRKFGGRKGDWTLNFSDKEMLEGIKKMILFSKYLKRECKKYNIKYFDVSKDFQKKLNDIFTYLTAE